MKNINFFIAAIFLLASTQILFVSLVSKTNLEIIKNAIEVYIVWCIVAIIVIAIEVKRDKIKLKEEVKIPYW